MTNEVAIEKIENHSRQGLEVLGDAEEMKNHLQAQDNRLQVVHEFIEGTFVKGVDFGPGYGPGSKDTLLKPGAEKVCKLFNTRPIWEVDFDTLKAMGSPAGTIAYKCTIINCATGEIVGEGRGADKIGNKQRDANKAIKNAEKCSLVDAVLWTFNLSERFTQDDGGRRQTQLNDEKASLVAEVGDLRIGVNSSMTTVAFLKSVSQKYLQQSSPETIGAVHALRKAIVEDHLFDLETGERIPDDI